MSIERIMSREVATVEADDVLLNAARLMRDRGVSSAVVTQDREVAGILTERDVSWAVASGADPETTRVGNLMTSSVVSVGPGDDILAAARVMADHGIRHLPVLEDGELVGIISIRDLLGWAIEEVTGGHELPDLRRGTAVLEATQEIEE